MSCPSTNTAQTCDLSDRPKESFLFKAKIKNTSGLLLVLADILCKEYSEKVVCLEILNKDVSNEDYAVGLQCRAVDGARCSFVDAFFPAGSNSKTFSSFYCSSTYMALWLCPKTLAKAINAASDKKAPSLLHLMVDRNSPDTLLIMAKRATVSGVVKSTRHQMGLFSPSSGDQTFVDGRDFKYTVSAHASTPTAIAEVLADLKSAECETVEIFITRQALMFKARNLTTSTQIEVVLRDPPGATGQCRRLTLHADSDTGYRAAFVVRHLMKLHKLSMEASEMLLQMGPNAPLSAVFTIAGGATCQCFIAPAIDDEEEEEGRVSAEEGS